MMAEKSDLRMDQRVRFRRSHDKTVELTGKIVRIHEDADCVDVQVEPDGKLAEIEITETAHAGDVTPLEEAAANTDFARSEE
jgi:hypothetical protein